MNRPELYHRTVGILYTAYFNDTLQHGDCCACAVGNIVAANMGYKIKSDRVKLAHSPYYAEYPGFTYWEGPDGSILHYPNNHHRSEPTGWGAYVCSTPNTQFIRPDALKTPIVRSQIKATGYIPEEVALIERVFESAKGETIEDRMFDGLCRVLDALEAIHEVHHQETIDQKKHFSEHYQTRVYAGTASISDRG